MRQIAVLFAFLALAAPAAASTPRFALFDLQSDLAQASRNVYGDVQVRPRTAVAGHGTLARCAAACRFGSGWLAFKAKPHLATADVATARSGYSKHKGWFVALTLRPAAVARWTAFARNVANSSKMRGVPDVLVVVAGGTITASPLATQVSSANGTVTLTGFSRASARMLATLLG